MNVLRAEQTKMAAARLPFLFALLLEHGHLLWWFFFDGSGFGFLFALGSHAFGLLDNHGNFFEVGANGVFQASLVQNGGGMGHGNTDPLINSTGATMNHADFFAAGELRHRVTTEGNDDAGVDGGN